MKIMLVIVQEDLPKHLRDVGAEPNGVSTELMQDIHQERIEIGSRQKGIIQGDSCRQLHRCVEHSSDLCCGGCVLENTMNRKIIKMWWGLVHILTRYRFCMVELDILMEHLVKGFEPVLLSKGLLILLETLNCCVSRLSNGRRMVRSRKFDLVSAIRLNWVGIMEVKYRLFIVGR